MEIFVVVSGKITERTWKRNLLKMQGTIFESLDGSFDRAIFPLPDYPTMDLVNYKHGMNNYYFYLEKAFALSKVLCIKAIAYYYGGNAEKDDAKKYIKNWNLDMGYFIRVKKTDDKKSIVVRFEHS